MTGSPLRIVEGFPDDVWDAAERVGTVSRELDDFDKCIKSSYIAAQLFAATPSVMDTILWLRWTTVCKAEVVMSKRDTKMMSFTYVTPSIIVAKVREEYEITAVDRRYRVRQVAYYAVNADECIEDVEKCVLNEMSSVRLLRTDVTSFEKLS